MTEIRYTVKNQDDLFGVVDNYSADKVCVINGIHTKIEAEWLCSHMNNLNNETEQLKKRNTNQYNQLDQLWQLIKAKNWETLTAMDNQMKEDEEQLKREWKCYE